MAKTSLISLLVLLAITSTALAQYNSVQESSEGGNYFSTMMNGLNSVSEMDWQGMLRSVVESLMQYFVAPTTRAGAATSRAISSFESDLVVNFVEKSPTLSHYAKTAHSYILSTSAPSSVDIAQVGGLLNFSWYNLSETPRASGRQSSTTVPPFVLDDNVRLILGSNPNLSDNKLLKSWQYVVWMIGYCVACTLFGLLSVTLLPDPNTLELIRSGGDDDDYDDMAVAAQSMSGVYGEMADTGDYMDGYKGQGGSGSQEAGNGGSLVSMGYGMQSDPGYAMPDMNAQTSDEKGNRKPEGYTKQKYASGEPSKNIYNHYLKSGVKQSAEQAPLSTHFQMIPANLNQASSGDSMQPQNSQESSYTSYSQQFD